MFHFRNISGHLIKGVVYSTSVAKRRTRARADGVSVRGVTTRAAFIFLVLTALLSLSVAAPTTSEARKKRVKGVFTCVNQTTGTTRVLVKTSKARCNPVQEFRLSWRKKRPKQRARMVVSQRTLSKALVLYSGGDTSSFTEAEWAELAKVHAANGMQGGVPTSPDMVAAGDTANPSAVNIVASVATCVKIKTGQARFAPASGCSKATERRTSFWTSFTTNQWLDLVRQAVISSLGDGASGGAGTVTGERPGAPTNLVGRADNGAAYLAWTAPSSNGSAITGYVIQVSTTPIGPFSDAPGCGTSVTSTAVNCTVTNLTNGTAYYFKVAAINGVGTSEFSPVSSATTPVTTASAMAAPSGASFNGQVVVSWVAPTGSATGGSGVTGYSVQVSTDASTGFAAAAGCTSSLTSTVNTCTATGLANGTPHYFKVAAINVVGTGAFSPASTAITPDTPPAAISVPTSIAGDSQVTLSWVAPTNAGSAITGYRVQVSTSASGTYSNAAGCTAGLTSTATTCVATGLSNGTTYYFKVAAINASGTGSASPPSTGIVPYSVPIAASAPTGSSGNSQVALAWTAPSANGSAITGYEVQVSTSSTGPFANAAGCTTAATSTATSCTATGLANGTAYYFTIAAINAAGTASASTASASVVPNTTADTASAPTGVAGDSQVALSWTPPSNSGTAITGYRVQVATSSGGTYSNATGCTAGLTSTATTCTATGLANGTAYYFKIAAINAAGTGTASAASASVTPYGVPVAASAPTGMSGNTQVVLVWAAPNANGSAITGYQVQVSTSSAGVYTDATGCTTAATSTATTCTATGLTNGTAYYFKIAAINAAGTASASAASASIVPNTVPNTASAPTGVAGDTQVALSWSAPSNSGSAITGYRVQVATSAAGSYADATGCTSASSSSGTTCTATGLVNGTTYYFKVAAINAAGTATYSAASSGVVPYGIPATASAPTGTAGNVQVALAWVAPSANGSAITGYQVQVATSASGSYSSATGCTANATSTATTCTATGLTNGTAYYFKVAAINAAGTATASSASSSLTPYTVAGAPAAASGTSGNTQVSLSWSAPASNGGSAITGYQVQVSTSAAGSYSNATGCTANATSTGTTCTATGLTNGTAYYFKIAAINAAGTGTASSASSGVTPYTVPGTPAAPTGTSANASVALSWSAPASNGGSAVTGYQVQVSTSAAGSYASAAGCTSAATSASTTCTATGLTNGTAYYFKIAAINAAGTGTQSAASSSVTPAVPSYTVGSSGPGGGTIFYVNNSGFACGPTLASTCTKLEAAPSTWYQSSGDPYAPFGCYGTDVTGANNWAIGTGAKNTAAIIAAGCSAPAGWTSEPIQSTASALAAAYRGGGYSDWYVPSMYELQQMYPNRATIGGFRYDQWYQSSSQSVQSCCNSRNSYGELAYFYPTSSTSTQYATNDKVYNYVRAIRAF